MAVTPFAREPWIPAYVHLYILYISVNCTSILIECFYKQIFAIMGVPTFIELTME